MQTAVFECTQILQLDRGFNSSMSLCRDFHAGASDLVSSVDARSAHGSSKRCCSMFPSTLDAAFLEKDSGKRCALRDRSRVLQARGVCGARYSEAVLRCWLCRRMRGGGIACHGAATGQSHHSTGRALCRAATSRPSMHEFVSVRGTLAGFRCPGPQADGVCPCQHVRRVAIVRTRESVTNPHVSHIDSPIAAIIALISVVVPVVAKSHAP